MKIVVIGGTGRVGIEAGRTCSVSTATRRSRPRRTARRQHHHRRGCCRRRRRGGRRGRRVELAVVRRRAAVLSSSRRRPATCSRPRRSPASDTTSRCPSSGRIACRTAATCGAKVAQEGLIAGFVDPVLDHPGDAVLRVHRQHRYGRHRRRHRPRVADAHPADGRRRRRQGGGRGRRWARRSNGTIEIAGPETFPLDELVRRTLSARHDPRLVVADPHARYFGTELAERSLVAGRRRPARRHPLRRLARPVRGHDVVDHRSLVRRARTMPTATAASSARLRSRSWRTRARDASSPCREP